MKTLGRKYGLSEETTRRAVIGLGFEYLEPISMPPLEQRHRDKRIEFSQLILQEPDKIQRIVFSDESMIYFEPNRKKIWRIPGEFADEWQVPVKEQPIRRMIWGAIGLNYKSPLIIVDGFLNGHNYVQTLERNGIFADLDAHYPNWSYFLQQDNAKCHTARASVSEFARRAIPVLQLWPARSPDLNLIEQLWAKIKDMIPLDNIRTQQELDNAIITIWNSIDVDTINNLVWSFPARIQTCLNLNGNCLNGHWKQVHQLHHPSY
jgi:hypothetical protein